MTATVILPVKSFALGKGRLAGSLTDSDRTRLARALAERVAAVVVASGRAPVVVTADPEVADWATDSGHRIVADPGGGLSAAARAGVEEVSPAGSWLVLHCDLPLLGIADVESVTAPLEEGRDVIAASADGGTSAIGSRGPFRFRFGPASFHRHLAALDQPLVITRPGLLLDIDSPADLRAAAGTKRGRWLQEVSLSPT